MVEKSEKKIGKHIGQMNHSVMVLGFLCLVFVPSLSPCIFSLSVTLIMLTWAGSWQKRLTWLQPINNHLTLKGWPWHPSSVG